MRQHPAVWPILLALAAALTLGMAGARRASAQQTVLVSGVVRDASAGQPLFGAIVTLGASIGARATRTDETGSFAFSNVVRGEYTVVVRRIGYQPASQTLDVRTQSTPIVVLLDRVAVLDTVRVRAVAQGISGDVGAARDLRPLSGAKIQVVGATGKVPVDSAGHFFVPIKTPGPYVIRAEAPGFAPQTVSVTVRPGEGVEAALLLDSATVAESHAFATAFADFNDRMMTRRNSSAIVPRSELMRDGDGRLLDALFHAPSFTRVALRLGPAACVFVNGRPRAGVSLASLDAADVEAIEAYTATSDASQTLARAWPRGFPCADTGLPRVGSGRDLVTWVVVWLKS